MGNFLTTTLQEENVDISLLKKTDRHLTGLVILGIDPPDHFPLIFYRENCADMQLRIEDVDKTFFAKAKALLITGTGLSTESMRAVSHHAIETASAVGTKVIFDLDYRPVLWGMTTKGDGESRYRFSLEVSGHYIDALKKSDLIVGTEEEMLIASGKLTIEEAVAHIRSLTPVPIVLKRGARGCSIYFDDLSCPLISKPFPVKILNVLGAGDAFISGLMRGLLRNESWALSAAYANAGGAIVVTRHGCAPAMPYFPEMQEFIKGYENVTISDT
jgi:5-dehydro-2-deoxygluconokinase